MRLRSSEEVKAAEFDLTPMIDVVLLLIIFFMLSSQFARVNAKVVNLPTEVGEAASEDAAPHEVVIDIDAKGIVTLGNSEVTDAELEGAIRGAGGGAEFVVRADKDCMASRLNVVALALVRSQVRAWRLAVAGSGGGGGGGGGEAAGGGGS
jgi:biopolymer transport protein ExbD